MSLLDKLFRKEYAPEVFKPPYPSSGLELTSQLITNIEKGILFEDNNQFLSWNTSYKKLKKAAIEIKEQGDRTIYLHGKRTVLNGLKLDFYTMKWIDTSPNVSFGSIESFLGQEDLGQKSAELVDIHLTENLGEPILKNEIDGEYTQEWKFQNVMISIVCWQHFAWKYEFKIGLIDEPNWSFLKK